MKYWKELCPASLSLKEQQQQTAEEGDVYTRQAHLEFGDGDPGGVVGSRLSPPPHPGVVAWLRCGDGGTVEVVDAASSGKGDGGLCS